MARNRSDLLNQTPLFKYNFDVTLPADITYSDEVSKRFISLDIGGESINEDEAPYKTNYSIPFPTSIAKGDLTITFIEFDDNKTSDFFEEWYNLVYDKTSKKFKLPVNYLKNIRIKVYGSHTGDKNNLFKSPREVSDLEQIFKVVRNIGGQVLASKVLSRVDPRIVQTATTLGSILYNNHRQGRREDIGIREENLQRPRLIYTYLIQDCYPAERYRDSLSFDSNEAKEMEVSFKYREITKIYE